MNKIKLISFLTIVFLANNSWGQERQLKIELYHNKGCYLTEYNQHNNKVQLDSIKHLLSQISKNKNESLKRITVHSFSSPLGGKTTNKELTIKRMINTRDYIIDSCGIDKSYIEGEGKGIDWKGLKASIENSEMPYKEEIIEILENTPEEIREKNRLVSSLNHHLMSLQKGIPYRYMEKYYFHKLRRTTITVVYSQNTLSESDTLNKETKNNISKHYLDIKRDIAFINRNKRVTSQEKNRNYHITPSVKRKQLSKKTIPLFALKTNLLYNIVLAPNIELEIPINKKWSINTELVYANWLNKNSFCWQILVGSIEGRYWLSNKTKQKALSGWFIGSFTSSCFYDFQFKHDYGHQGKSCLLTGLSSGYTKYINKNWGIEFSGGIGYLINNYRKYKITNNELIKDGQTMQYKSILPAKIKCSIVWYIK